MRGRSAGSARPPTVAERPATVGEGPATRPPGGDFHLPTAPAQGGVPAWLAATLNFCSRCGAPLTFGPIEGEDRDRLGCEACGFIAYVNPRVVVTTLPVTEAGELVLLRRGIEPGYGTWAQPGGFLEIDETIHDGAVRETLEETGLVVEPGEIIGIYSRTEAAIVVVAFEARILGGEYRTGPETLELAAFSPPEIPWAGITLKTSLWAIRDWVRRVSPEFDLDRRPRL